MGRQTDVSLPADRRGEAMMRFEVLRPHLEDDVPLARAARTAGVPLRTARRWLERFRRDGVAGLGRAERVDRGRRRLPVDLVRVVEGMALTDANVLSLLVFAFAIAAPLALQALINVTGFGRFLFERPSWISLPATTKRQPNLVTTLAK